MSEFELGAVRDSTRGPDSDRGVLAMSGLGEVGRFGNQIFQYAFLRICAKVSGMSVETAPWIGQDLFGHNDPPISRELEYLVENDFGFEVVLEILPELLPFLEKRRGRKSRRIGVDGMVHGLPSGDVYGVFQPHTRHFRPHKDFFRSLFKPQEDLRPWLDEPLTLLRERGKTVVAIHLRTGDYTWLPHLAWVLVVPPEWWAEWLESIWGDLDDPVLYLCSNDVGSVRRCFQKFNPVTAEDLKVPPPERLRGKSVDFYRDYHVLTQADVVGVSNSSFSFSAAMLNERARTFVRPHWDFETRFTSFDPWDAYPLLFVDDPESISRKGYLKMLRTARETSGLKGAALAALLYHPVGSAAALGVRLKLARYVSGWRGVRDVLLGRTVRPVT